MFRIVLVSCFCLLPFSVNGGILKTPTSLQDDGECRQVLTAETGSFTSPNYPEDYPDNSICIWEIVVEEGQRIRLSFTDFHLEASFECSNDYLSIYDGRDTTIYCGRNIPPEIESVGNEMSVTFLTDEVIHVGDRFAAEYETIDGGVAEECQASVDVSDLDTYGFFKSPNHPGRYPNGVSCRYDLLKADNSTLLRAATRIAFLGLKTSGSMDSSSAMGDVVTISVGGSAAEALAGDYQQGPGTSDVGLSSLPIFNNFIDQNVSVSFVADEQDNDVGFIFAFASNTGSTLDVEEERKQTEKRTGKPIEEILKRTKSRDVVRIDLASHTISASNPRLANVAHFGSPGRQDDTADYGFFMSPNHPNNYANGEDVTYSITVPEGSKVAIYALRFRTELGYDYFSLFDDQTPNDYYYTSGTTQMSYVWMSSTSNTATARFTSDSSNTYSGFLVAFAAVNATSV